MESEKAKDDAARSRASGMQDVDLWRRLRQLQAALEIPTADPLTIAEVGGLFILDGHGGPRGATLHDALVDYVVRLERMAAKRVEQLSAAMGGA